jgi:hypothetical protein
MNERVRQLIPAIVSYVNEHGSYVSKTKLLKLLYLFDIEWYRDHGETFTGFEWLFFHLGPWSREYNALLEQLTANLAVNVRRTADAGFDTEFFSTPEPVDFSRLFESYADEKAFRIAVSTWGQKSTAEILDYVYFWTEPMKDAERYKPLSFASVSNERPQQYKRTSSGATREEIAAARQRIIEMRKSQGKSISGQELPSPNYDDEYFQAMEELEAMN